jgi:hypothetical protein
MLKISKSFGVITIFGFLAACGGGGGEQSSSENPKLLQGPTKSLVILDSVKGELVTLSLGNDQPTVTARTKTNGHNLAYGQYEQTVYLSNNRPAQPTTAVNLKTGTQRSFGDKYRSQALVKVPSSYLYSAYTGTFSTGDIIRPGTQGYVQRISTESGAVEYSDSFGTPEFSALAVHPSNNIVYAVEPKVQAPFLDPLCLQGTCTSQVTIYSLAITDNPNAYSGGIFTQWFKEVVIDDYMSVRDASFSPDGSMLYISGSAGQLWPVNLIENSMEALTLRGLPDYQGATYFEVEAGGDTGLLASRNLGLYRVDLNSGISSLLVEPGVLFTGVSGLQVIK